MFSQPETSPTFFFTLCRQRKRERTRTARLTTGAPSMSVWGGGGLDESSCAADVIERPLKQELTMIMRLTIDPFRRALHWGR